MIKYIIVFLVSMVPLIELRLAVPLGIGMGLNPIIVYFISVIGNMIPVPFIYLFAKRILKWGKDKPLIGGFFSFCLNKGKQGGEKLQSKAGKGMFFALVLFVGIPVPGTGAWTGSLAASILDLDMETSVLGCVCGIVLAAILMSMISYGAFDVLTGIF